MRHDIADAILFVIMFIFSLLEYNICQEVTDNKIQKLDNEIISLNKKVDSLQIVVNNKQDTLFIKVYNAYNKKK